MKFFIDRASSFDNEKKPCKEATLDKKGKWIIEISSLKKLLEFTKGTEHSRIILEYEDSFIHPRITIYDDYIE